MDPQKASIIEHLGELRRRLIVLVIFFSIFSILGYFLSDMVIKMISEYLTEMLGIDLISIHPMEVFFTKLNIAIFIGAIFSLPVLFVQAYFFARPGLTKEEAKMVKTAIPLSAGLFILGCVFALFLIFRFILWFFSGLADAAGILNLWDINSFTSFLFYTCISFGIVFQLPIFTFVLMKLGVIKREALKSNRPFAVILIFIIAAVITPTPDPFTQTILAIPMILLYELSVFSARFIKE